jgi:hypothetical protein
LKSLTKSHFSFFEKWFLILIRSFKFPLQG